MNVHINQGYPLSSFFCSCRASSVVPADLDKMTATRDGDAVEQRRSASQEADKIPQEHLEDAPNGAMVTAVGEEDGKLNKETILACIAIAGQINAYVMSLLIPSTTLSYINAELGPDPNFSWITIVWQLGGSIIVSISGRLSDIFGRRYFMITGASISIVGCLVGANGTSINMMIASGTLFGIGSGFQEMAYGCIQEMLPNKHRMVGVGTSAPVLFFLHTLTTSRHARRLPRCSLLVTRHRILLHRVPRHRLARRLLVHVLLAHRRLHLPVALLPPA